MTNSRPTSPAVTPLEPGARSAALSLSCGGWTLAHALGAAVWLALPGALGDWPTVRGNPQRTGFTPTDLSFPVSPGLGWGLDPFIGTGDALSFKVAEERQVHFGENFADPPDFALGAFRALTWLEGAPAEELAHRVDLPWAGADLYHIIKLAPRLEPESNSPPAPNP